MTGWQWFWALVGLIIYLIVLILLYYSAPFEALFNLVVNGLSYANVIFWAAVIVGIVGFCGYHWRAYRVHVARQRQVESMVPQLAPGLDLHRHPPERRRDPAGGPDPVRLPPRRQRARR